MNSRPITVSTIICSRYVVRPLWARTATGLFIGYLSILLTFCFAPFHPTRFAKSDSGVFLYIGQQIINGHKPYLAAWDHKPPLIFYLNALGLLLGRGSLWGVWSLSLIACVLGIWCGYWIVAHLYGRACAILAISAMGVFLMATMEYANIAELYAFPIQLLIVYLFLHSNKLFCLFVIGALGGVLSLLRPNLIGMLVAVTLVFICRYLHKWRYIIIGIIAIGAGLLFPILIFAGYFAAYGLLRRAYVASFLFNIEYSEVAWHTRLMGIMPGINTTFAVGLALIIAVSAIFALTVQFSKQSAAGRLLAYIGIVDLIVEIGMSSISGRGYLHYFITWAAPVGLLAGYAGYLILQLSIPEKVRLLGRFQAAAGALAVVIVIGFLQIVLLRGAAQKAMGRSDDLSSEALARYIASVTTESQTIYVWGYGPEIYVMSHRMSPSRFFMHTPLALRKFRDRGMISEIMSDLQKTPPQLIVDSSYTVDGMYPHLDAPGGQGFLPQHTPDRPAALKPLFAFVKDNYERVKLPNIGKWVVYMRQKGSSDIAK